jgi:hypothetical protein
MRTKNLSFALLLFIAAACSTSTPPTLAPEYIFDSQGLSVITSSFNNKQQTMSALYGNAAAIEAATSGNGKHVPGEEYRLITWKQESNPLWFGSNINGVLNTVERVSTSVSADGDLNIRYEILRGNPTDLTNGTFDEQKRIRYILDLKPSVFP